MQVPEDKNEMVVSSIKPLQHLKAFTAMALPMVMVLLATGCGGGSQPALVQSNGGGSSAPVDVSSGREYLDINMLSDLPRTNPFLSLLAKPEVPTDAGPQIAIATPPPTPEPVNPFTGYSLSGIIYRGGKNSLGILNTPSGRSKIVHIGDVLPVPELPSAQLKVTKVEKDRLTLQVLGFPPPDGAFTSTTESFKIPSIIGYVPQGSTQNSTAAKSAMTTGSVPQPPAGASAPAAGASPGGGDLDAQFKELMELAN